MSRLYRFDLRTIVADAAALADRCVADEGAALDWAEKEIRAGLTAAAKDEGDPPPLFRRDGNYLEITACPEPLQ